MTLDIRRNKRSSPVPEVKLVFRLEEIKTFLALYDARHHSSGGIAESPPSLSVLFGKR